MRFDLSLDEINNQRFYGKYHNVFRQMKGRTQFNDVEIKSVVMVYHKFALCNEKGIEKMSRSQFNNLFLVLFKVLDTEMVDRIYYLLTKKRNSKYIEPIAWVEFFSVLMTTNLEEQMRFVFDIYDIKEKGSLDRQLVEIAVKKMLKGSGEEDDEIKEMRKDMTELLLAKFDLNKDNEISYEEYAQVVRKQPLLLEFMGQVFPSINDKNTILHCFGCMQYLKEVYGNPENIEI